MSGTTLSADEPVLFYDQSGETLRRHDLIFVREHSAVVADAV